MRRQLALLGTIFIASCRIGPDAAQIPAPQRTSGASSPSVSGGTVAGVVINAEVGQGIAAAQVRLSGRRRGAVADDFGRFVLDSVPPGEWWVVAESIGSRRDSVQVVVGERAGAAVRFVLPSVPVCLSSSIGPGIIAFVADAVTNEAPHEAVMRVRGQPEASTYVVDLPVGDSTLTRIQVGRRLAEGVYEVEFGAAGYETWRGEVEVQEGCAATLLNIWLIPTSTAGG